MEECVHAQDVFFSVGAQLLLFFSVGTQLFSSVLGHSCFFVCLFFQCWDTAVFFSVGTQLFSSVLRHSFFSFSFFFLSVGTQLDLIFFKVGTRLFSSLLEHSRFLQCWGTAVFFSVGTFLQ